ncbi:glycoside hydrolase family 3 N-terminal domain-containing protein [Staphylococcus chromogenes]|uniref:glycoside hydrolase family 3 N-terminal domain-containing protein n=1 Tax=Staphylococcus chromogenes TaxID=46126 RepID=UPI0030CA1FA1
MDGYRQTEDMVTCVKHFPGDGTEERDQHPVLGVNELSVEEWDQSFRKVYENHIDRGVEMIMAGHIAQPAYSQLLNPQLEEKDILPATLSKELITDLLKKDLNFN